ncbi:hypothetical protein [Phaeobacter italicus]|jgi:hypothetical protein|uniref:hypothetical protein n=1 Tax=Phaeobacter italicus TaxID=481446 RepID=UPI002FDA868A
MPRTAERTTRVDDDKIEVIDNYSGMTRDTVILAREAAHRMVVDGLRSIEMIQTGKDYHIEVRSRR